MLPVVILLIFKTRLVLVYPKVKVQCRGGKSPAAPQGNMGEGERCVGSVQNMIKKINRRGHYVVITVLSIGVMDSKS